MTGKASYSGGEFDLAVDRRDHVVVVRLRGNATLSYSEQLQDRLLSAAGEVKPPRLVVDLSELDFINSVGLGAFVTAHLRCSGQKGSFRLAAPRSPVADLLSLTKLSSLLAVYPTVQAACGD